MKNINVIQISALIVLVSLNLFFFLNISKILKEESSVELERDTHFANTDIVEESDPTTDTATELNTTIDEGIEVNVAIDEYGYEKDIMESHITDNTGIVFENIRKALGYSRDIVYPIQVPEQLSADLFFQFITSLDQCDSLDVVFEKEELQRACRYEYYLKQVLTNNNVSIPEDFLEYNNNLLRSISQKTCNIEGNYICMLLNDDNVGSSRADFLKQSSEYSINNNIEMSDIPFVSFGFYVFQEDIQQISTIEDVSNIYYDKALVYKAVSENDVSICLEILNQSFKFYCQDYFSEGEKVKYEALFDSFHSGLKE